MGILRLVDFYVNYKLITKSTISTIIDPINENKVFIDTFTVQILRKVPQNLLHRREHFLRLYPCSPCGNARVALPRALRVTVTRLAAPTLYYFCTGVNFFERSRLPASNLKASLGALFPSPSRARFLAA